MKNRKKLSKKDAQATCDAWNRENPVGTAVVVTKDRGEQVPTSTRSDAYLIGDDMPVIMLVGISGCYDLSRVRPARD